MCRMLMKGATDELCLSATLEMPTSRLFRAKHPGNMYQVSDRQLWSIYLDVAQSNLY